MLSSKMKTLACGVSAACLLAYASAAQAQAPGGEAINIGVAANFANSINDIIVAFNTAYGYDPNDLGLITVTSDSTANLQACITNSAVSCPAGPYDLFLAANTAAPAALATYGMIYSGVTQTRFFYAQGSLVLGARSVNINDCPTPAAGNSCGLPTTGSSIYTNFVIADPSKAPYGLAAMQVLNGLPGYSLTTLSPYPVGSVSTSPNIGTTYSAVNLTSVTPHYAYGFVAKSQVCQNGVLSGTNVTHAFEYAYSGASVTYSQFGHSTTTPPYGEIIQDGLPIELGQTAGTKAEILQLINYLTTNVSSPGYTHNNGQGYAIIKRYCYGLTP